MGNLITLCDQETPPNDSSSCFCGHGTFRASYELGPQIGKGGQARVYVCVERATGKERAVKVFDRSEWFAFEYACSAYQRELTFLQACNDARLVQILDHFVDSGRCHLVMERYACHLRKGLRNVAKEGPFFLGNTALQNILQQAFGAVFHLHGRSIVHRDVKAQNLLVDMEDIRNEDCRVVLSDLGFAHLLGCGDILTSQVGTRKYWPPEVWDRRYWHAVDIFALGVLAFLCATGSFPYPDEQALRSRDILREEGSVPEHLDAGAKGFLWKSLEKDPQKRATVEQLSDLPWLQDRPRME